LEAAEGSDEGKVAAKKAKNFNSRGLSSIGGLA
jgi:hypothetical protein